MGVSKTSSDHGLQLSYSISGRLDIDASIGTVYQGIEAFKGLSGKYYGGSLTYFISRNTKNKYLGSSAVFALTAGYQYSTIDYSSTVPSGFSMFIPQSMLSRSESTTFFALSMFNRIPTTPSTVWLFPILSIQCHLQSNTALVGVQIGTELCVSLDDHIRIVIAPSVGYFHPLSENANAANIIPAAITVGFIL